ncbi:MAG TPA: phosphatase PAP2 family protein [Sphingomicrobium sp.]|nr:phosphatase PAP2 family protein [Sphingomicrobium sp.]
MLSSRAKFVETVSQRQRLTSWVIPTAVVVAIEYSFALLVGYSVGFQYQIPFADYLLLGLTVAMLVTAAIIVAQLAFYAMQREPAPARRLLGELIRVAAFSFGAVLIALQMAVLAWTKIMLPIASPFWADPLLADIDRALFGSDPWLLANASLGSAGAMIDQIYVSWAPIKFATTIILLLASESAAKSRAMIAYFLMMALTAIGQYSMSSAGPIFYADLGFGPRFEQLPVHYWVEVAKAYLWHDYLRAGGDIGGGISAMPSLHVAAAVWIALVWNSFDRRIGAVGVVYASIILFGSVLLGWHYFVDGIAGILITLVAWAAAPWLAKPFLRTRLSPDERVGNPN